MTATTECVSLQTLLPSLHSAIALFATSLHPFSLTRFDAKISSLHIASPFWCRQPLSVGCHPDSRVLSKVCPDSLEPVLFIRALLKAGLTLSLCMLRTSPRDPAAWRRNIISVHMSASAGWTRHGSLVLRNEQGFLAGAYGTLV